MIEPPPPAIISGSTARLSRNEPVRLTASTRSHSARVGLEDGAARIVRGGAADQDVEPAKGLCAAAAAARVSLSSETSQCWASARPPASSTSRAVSAAPVESMSQQATAAPASAKASAIARPMPPAGAADQRCFSAQAHRALPARSPPDQTTSSVRGSIRCIWLRSATSGIASPATPAAAGLTRPHTSTPSTVK